MRGIRKKYSEDLYWSQSNISTFEVKFAEEEEDAEASPWDFLKNRIIKNKIKLKYNNWNNIFKYFILKLFFEKIIKLKFSLKKNNCSPKTISSHN